jgi:hypothetical protein
MKQALFTIALLFFFLTSCNQSDISPSDSVKGTTVVTSSQFVFGHLGSFKSNPDCLYKFENNNLYTTHPQPGIDVNNPSPFYQINASDSIKAAIKDLLSNIPSSFSTNTSHEVGSYFPDVGFTYFQIQDPDKKSYWFIQANTPSDVTPFASQLNNIIHKLGQ